MALQQLLELVLQSHPGGAEDEDSAYVAARPLPAASLIACAELAKPLRQSW